MSALATNVRALLTGISRDHITTLSPNDRQQLANELERVHRLIETERVIQDARDATRPRAAFMAELEDGRGRE